jgi:hypothetical protein
MVLVVAVAEGSLQPGPRPLLSLALATDRDTVATTISADVLDPPTAVRCSGGLVACTVSILAKPTLVWTATSDPYATGYTVHRSTSGGPYAPIASVAGRTTTAFTDTTVGALATYTYVLRAVSPAWESAPSNEVTILVVL